MSWMDTNNVLAIKSGDNIAGLMINASIDYIIYVGNSCWLANCQPIFQKKKRRGY